MKLLEDYISEKGRLVGKDIVKVDSFLNHQVDPLLMQAMGKEIKRLFADTEITKILTIEASGIAIAVMAALELNVPMVFAKKNATKNLSSDVYSTTITSFTHGRDYDVRVAKDFLGKDDKILIIDDFLANGAALQGLIEIVNQSGASVSGCAIAIEKGFQDGGKKLREKGYRIESLAIIEGFADNKVLFRK